MATSLKNEVTSGDRDAVTHADSFATIWPHRGFHQAKKVRGVCQARPGRSSPRNVAAYSQMKSLLSTLATDTPSSVICRGPM